MPWSAETVRLHEAWGEAATAASHADHLWNMAMDADLAPQIGSLLRHQNGAVGRICGFSSISIHMICNGDPETVDIYVNILLSSRRWSKRKTLWYRAHTTPIGKNDARQKP